LKGKTISGKTINRFFNRLAHHHFAFIKKRERQNYFGQNH